MAFEKEQVEKMGLTWKEGMTDDEVYDGLAKMKEKADKYDPLKSSFDKTASELKGFKDKAKEGQTEIEKANERITELEKSNADLVKASQLRDIYDTYRNMGYDEKDAQAIAEAQLSGDFKKVGELQKAFLTKHDEEVKKELLKQTPPPSQGDPNIAVPKTQEEFNKLTYSQLLVLKEKNPTVYEQFTKKK